MARGRDDERPSKYPGEDDETRIFMKIILEYTFWLVVCNMFVFHILGRIIPTDVHTFQRGRAARAQPPTSFNVL